MQVALTDALLATGSGPGVEAVRAILSREPSSIRRCASTCRWL